MRASIAVTAHTDKKENHIFLLYKEIQMESVAKSYMTITASSYMVKYLRISSYIRRPFLINEFATDPIWISLYMRKISFSFFISAFAIVAPLLHTS